MYLLDFLYRLKKRVVVVDFPCRLKVEDHRELFGQILPRDGGFVKDASVHLQNEEERIGSAELNSLGEFLFTRIPDGLLSLQIDLPYVTVISALRTTY